jgi:hypothetical protein
MGLQLLLLEQSRKTAPFGKINSCHPKLELADSEPGTYILTAFRLTTDC